MEFCQTGHSSGESSLTERGDSPSTLTEDDAATVALITGGDGMATRKLFYEDLRPVVMKAIHDIYDGQADYAELTGELYLYLQQSDWYRLRTFISRGGCSLHTWLNTVAWRFFVAIRRRIAPLASHPVFSPVARTERGYDPTERLDSYIDVRGVLERMPCRRYASAVDLLVLQERAPEEAAVHFGISAAALYNLKHRALSQFRDVYTA